MDLNVVLSAFYKDVYDSVLEEGAKLTVAAVEAGEHNNVIMDDNKLERFIDTFMIMRCMTYGMNDVHVSTKVFDEHGGMDGDMTIESKSLDFDHPELLALAIQKCGNFGVEALTNGNIIMEFTLNNLARFA